MNWRSKKLLDNGIEAIANVAATVKENEMLKAENKRLREQNSDLLDRLLSKGQDT